MYENGIGIKNPLFFIGVVENNVDERLEGRVQVRAFGVHGTVQQVPTENLPWAIPISGSYDPNCAIPPLNSWVFGFFIDGRDAQQPMILGLIPTQMTEPIEPERTGWGVIPPRDVDVLSKGARSQDFGQPMQSRLARGENIEETYNLALEVSRVKDIGIGGNEEETWEEPGSAYNAEYPYNRVIETASGHSIEMDDTPGAERIMIWHRSGSYVQIDVRGTTVHKSTSDKYEINDVNQHVYVGGKSVVTIEGDSYVLVKGNKIEEIVGDYTQIVRGNHMVSIAGQMNLNVSDEAQIRAAKIRIESNVENINLKAAKNVRIESGESIHITSGQNMFTEVTETTHLKSDNIRIGGNTRVDISSEGTLFIESEGAMNIKSNSNMFVQATGTSHLKSNVLRIGGGSRVDIDATNVNIDDLISMANGDAIAPSNASATTAPEEATPAEATELPQPAEKAASTSKHRNQSSIGTAGYSSSDDENTSNFEPLDESVTEGILKPLLDLIGRAEGAGYNTVFGGSRIQTDKQITSQTIRELLNWQDRSVAAGSVSSAVGRYQIIRGTVRTLIGSGVVTNDDIFSASTQDKMAIHLLQVRGLNRFLSGSLSSEGFANNLSKEWASLPVASGPQAGYSYYEGVAGNKSRVSVSDVLNVLNEIKEDYSRPRIGPQ